MKVLFVVTHLLGTGHLARTLVLAKAFVARGHKAIVLSGGMPAPHLDATNVEVVQLPPLRADGLDFRRHLDAHGQVATDDYIATRGALMEETFQELNPDVLITELFPFGRRSLRSEFEMPLKSAAKREHGPLVLASIRDILAPPSTPRRAQYARDTLDAFYDAVLVHSDPDLTPLALSWPVDDSVEQLLRYTGFVAPPAPSLHPDALGTGEILVSAGGGNIGSHLFECAKRAAALDPDNRWRLLLGGQQIEGKIADLQRNAPPNLIVEPARPDFRQMLNHAVASVSLCGYNTAQDILQTGCPAVFVPFDAGDEVEQGIRAEALGKLDGISVVKSAELEPEALLHSIIKVISDPKRPLSDSFDGANKTVEIVESMLMSR